MDAGLHEQSAYGVHLEGIVVIYLAGGSLDILISNVDIPGPEEPCQTDTDAPSKEHFQMRCSLHGPLSLTPCLSGHVDSGGGRIKCEGNHLKAAEF